MQQALLFIGLVACACVLSNRIATKLPAPSLLAFIGLGMLLGENGPLHIPFDDYALTEQICCVALVFIMFYGGFNTNIERARPVAVQAVLLSTVGVLVTVAATGAFCHLAFGLGWLEGLLVGAVIASTDAASVFNALREHHLSLKDGTDSLLELESGSNDPLAYILTVALSSLLIGEPVDVPAMLAQQVLVGVAVGVGAGWLLARLLDRGGCPRQSEVILLIACAIVSYSGANILGGSGFLAVYLAGMVLGASDVPAKREMAQVFDVLTEISQMATFFMIGLLVTPADLPAAVLPALALVAFLTLVARPLAVGAILLPFGSSPRRIALASWAGLRGAASAVFALYAVVAGVPGGHDLFNLVFVAVVVSLLVQGSLLPRAARGLGMVDADGDVMRTFNDYRDDADFSFIKIKVDAGHPHIGRTLAQIDTLEGMLVVLILRDGAHPVLPTGSTVIESGDLLVIAAPTFEERPEVALREYEVGRHHRWAGRLIRELDDTDRFVIALVRRGGESIIPDGATRIEVGDSVLVATLDSAGAA